LRKQGCSKLRQGGDHEIWHNPANGKRAPVSRHKELPTTTALGICDQLGVNRFS
jgi:hypothetical protein